MKFLLALVVLLSISLIRCNTEETKKDDTTSTDEAVNEPKGPEVEESTVDEDGLEEGSDEGNKSPNVNVDKQIKTSKTKKIKKKKTKKKKKGDKSKKLKKVTKAKKKNGKKSKNGKKIKKGKKSKGTKKKITFKNGTVVIKETNLIKLKKSKNVIKIKKGKKSKGTKKKITFKNGTVVIRETNLIKLKDGTIVARKVKKNKKLKNGKKNKTSRQAKNKKIGKNAKKSKKTKALKKGKNLKNGKKLKSEIKTKKTKKDKGKKSKKSKKAQKSKSKKNKKIKNEEGSKKKKTKTSKQNTKVKVDANKGTQSQQISEEIKNAKINNDVMSTTTVNATENPATGNEETSATPENTSENNKDSTIPASSIETPVVLESVTNDGESCNKPVASANSAEKEDKSKTAEIITELDEKTTGSKIMAKYATTTESGSEKMTRTTKQPVNVMKIPKKKTIKARRKEGENVEGEEQLSGDAQQPIDDQSMYFVGLMESHYEKFEKSNEGEKKLEFAKLIPNEIDTDKDGVVSFQELHQWILHKIEEDAMTYEFSDGDLAKMDTDSDGKISWSEYEADQRASLKSSDEETVSRVLRKEKMRFNYIDQNKDGFITTEEVPRLLAPESFADLNEMAVESYVADFDLDGDNKITYEEWEKSTRDDPNVDDPKEHFELHDKNKDNVLTKDELRDHALDNIAAPHIERELRTIVRILDENTDEVLSTKELLKGFLFFTDSKAEVPMDELEKTYDMERNENVHEEL